MCFSRLEFKYMVILYLPQDVRIEQRCYVQKWCYHVLSIFIMFSQIERTLPCISVRYHALPLPRQNLAEIPGSFATFQGNQRIMLSEFWSILVFKCL